MIECLNFGAGVQSTTLLLLSCKGLLPKLDRAIFADTQWEPAAVYRHLEWCKEHASKHGIQIDVRTAGNLRQDLIDFWGPKRASADGKRHASIPAFVKNPDGSKGIVNRQCTSAYKIDVIERWLRQEVLGLKFRERWPLACKVRQWIGISADEPQRMKRSTRPAFTFWHPLIEADAIAKNDHKSLFARGWTRQDCLEWIASRGYPTPPRSACIGCPFHSNGEWGNLTAEELADACEVDDLIRQGNAERKPGQLIGQPFLHSSLIPLREIDFGNARENEIGWSDECGGVCGV